MAALNEENRAEAHAEGMRELSRREELLALTKPELRAAFDAADDWAQANAANFNAALPTAAQAGLTATQKAWLLTRVIERRWKVGA